MEQLFDCELNRYGKSDTDNDATKENRFTAEVIHTVCAPFVMPSTWQGFRNEHPLL